MLDPGSWTKYYSTFNQTNCHLALKIWVGDPGTVSGHSIPDPDPLHKQNRIQVHNCGSGSESLPGRCGPGMTPFLLLLLFSNIPDSSLLHFVCSGLLLFLIIFSFFTFTFTFTNVFCSFIIFFMYDRISFLTDHI